MIQPTFRHQIVSNLILDFQENSNSAHSVKRIPKVLLPSITVYVLGYLGSMVERDKVDISNR
jgi:hypothetical protein